MHQVWFFRFGIIVCIILASGVVIPAHLWADQTQESQPAKSGSRTVESGPSLSSMEKESGSGGSGYNSEYIFALTKDVLNSSMPNGAKVVVSIFSVAADLVFLPVAAILGFFGD